MDHHSGPAHRLFLLVSRIRIEIGKALFGDDQAHLAINTRARPRYLPEKPPDVVMNHLGDFGSMLDDRRPYQDRRTD